MTSRSELGRQTQDRITTLASGADGAVRRISTTYEVRGMVNKLTSYDNATVGSGSVVNEVQHAYNSFGQLTTQYQEHAAGVNTGTSPKVQYAYADGSANHVRPTKITYPSGRIVRYEYGSSTMDDYLSRISYLADDSSGSIGTHLAEYTYLGLATVVKVDYTEPDVRLDWAFGTGDDPYDGLDRFDRVQDQRWYDYGASADAARIKHGYDRAGNRLWREDTVAAANSKNFDELYAYDGIYRLEDFQRGDLNSSKTGISTGTLNFAQDWGFDPLGNWTSFKEDAAGDGTFELDQTRTVNKVNEITGITGGSWVVPAYDRNGNMTTMPQPATPTSGYTATYDAWNRLVKLVDGSNTVAEYQYDGQKWRTITKSYTSGTLSETRHHYYSKKWQVIEERIGSSATADQSYVWGLRTLNDLILRDRDTDSNGTLDERLYAMQDPSWNTIAVAASDGTIVERFAYAPYGRALFLTPSYTTASSTSVQWSMLFGGHPSDAASLLLYARNRLANPTIGTWVQRDRACHKNCVSFYRFCNDNPIVRMDLFGLKDEIIEVDIPYDDIPLALNCPTPDEGGGQPCTTRFLLQAGLTDKQRADCDANVAMAMDDELVKRLIRAMNRIFMCQVPAVSCVCCTGPCKDAGGWHIENEVFICAEKEPNAGMVASYLAHEFIHHYQTCTRAIPGDCLAYLKAEFQAPYCAGQCSDFRSCLELAAWSACYALNCTAQELPRAVAALYEWYQDNVRTMCQFR